MLFFHFFSYAYNSLYDVKIECGAINTVLRCQKLYYDDYSTIEHFFTNLVIYKLISFYPAYPKIGKPSKNRKVGYIKPKISNHIVLMSKTFDGLDKNLG